jgi:hypothetical protein
MDVLLHTFKFFLIIEHFQKKNDMLSLRKKWTYFVSEEYCYHALTHLATSGCGKQPPFHNIDLRKQRQQAAWLRSSNLHLCRALPYSSIAWMVCPLVSHAIRARYSSSPPLGSDWLGENLTQSLQLYRGDGQSQQSVARPYWTWVECFTPWVCHNHRKRVGSSGPFNNSRTVVPKGHSTFIWNWNWTADCTFITQKLIQKQYKEKVTKKQVFHTVWMF